MSLQIINILQKIEKHESMNMRTLTLKQTEFVGSVQASIEEENSFQKMLGSKFFPVILYLVTLSMPFIVEDQSTISWTYALYFAVMTSLQLLYKVIFWFLNNPDTKISSKDKLILSESMMALVDEEHTIRRKLLTYASYALVGVLFLTSHQFLAVWWLILQYSSMRVLKKVETLQNNRLEEIETDIDTDYMERIISPSTNEHSNN